MRCTWEGLPGVKRVGLLVVRGVLVSSAVLFCLPCLADLPSLPVVPQPIAWVPGPATADLGSEAEVKVPENYSFTDASGARAFLEGMRTPVPKGLVGVLQPNSGGWWVTFEYSELGFVKENEKDQLDPVAILKNFYSARSPSQVTWEVKPVFDATQHSLEWAVRTEGGSEKGPVIKHTVRLLGRRGVLDVVVTRSGRDAAALGVIKGRGASSSSLDASRDSSGLSALKELANKVSFKDGQSYADYKQGDKVAAFGLSGLITGSLASASGDAAARTEASGGIRAFWIGLVVIVVVGVCASVLLIKKLSRQRSLAPVVQASAPVVAQRPVAPQAAVPAVNGSKSRHAEKASPALKNSNNGHHARSRRKVFNYQKFYTEMVLQGPAPVIGVETNGYELDLNRLALQVEAPKAADSTAVLNVNSELIAHQKAIIEEQKRLIQEQGKLIDEKTRLISEKNQLLQRQSDLIDNNLV